MIKSIFSTTVSTVPSGPLPSSSSASVLLSNYSTRVVVALCNCFFLSLVASSKTSAYFLFTLFNSFLINLCNNHICLNCVGVLCLVHLFKLVLTFCWSLCTRTNAFWCSILLPSLSATIACKSTPSWYQWCFGFPLLQ